MRYFTFILLLSVLCLPTASAQKSPERKEARFRLFPDRDSLRQAIDRDPPFGIYKDNYVVTGSSFSPDGATPENSDMKFQVSLRYRLIQGVLPYNTYLFFTYTQKSFWNLYERSKPFSDNNYNPTLGLGNLISRHGKAVGLVMFQYEHESNGLDSTDSRCWNKFSLMGQMFFNRNFALELKLWIPFQKENHNADIVRYCGYGLLAGSYTSNNDRLRLSAVFTKRGGWNLNANTELEVAWKPIRRCNLYLALQYYNGYGEGLLAYNRYHNYVRLGIAIKPRRMTIY